MASMADEEETCLPSPEQTQIINEINNPKSAMKEGDTYYLLSSQWYSQYQNHITQLTPLRPIDNQPLIISKDQNLELKTSLQEGIDYVLVSEDVWKKLYELYNGGPELPRKVITEGIQNSLVVEVYLLRVYVHDERDGKIYDIEISKKASLNCLYDQVKKLLGVGDDEKIHLWDYFDNIRSYKRYIALNQSLEEACVMNNEDILVEVKNRDDEGGCNSGYSIKYCFGSSFSSPLMIMDDVVDAAADADVATVDGFILGEVKKGDMGGLVGLQNLGNTCFMNSAIQCLVHTPPLVEYFMGDYSEEINKGNPIGMQGELAMEFGDLLRKLWSSSGGGAISPSVFKKKLAQFAPQFGGFNQHDSHELLAFLMDGLHEDLNRVTVKPYVVPEDADGRSDNEVANECWEFHKARNDSVIVDVCQGQYKLTLVCPECGRVSVTFDPFMYLSLPLLSETTRSMTITVFSSNGTALPKSYMVKVLRDGSLENLVDALSIECSLKSDETLLLAEIFRNAVHKYFEDLSDPVSEILDQDYIVAYRIPKKPEGYTTLEIIHGIKGEKLLGTPIVTYLVEAEQSYEDIQNAVHMAVKPLLFDMEIPSEEMKDDHEFKLFESDDNRGRVCRRIKSDFIGRVDRVLVDWNNRDFSIYDISYLEDLSAVYTSESDTSISLISCLEAFLKEEPLGPDDMWFCPSCKELRQASKKLDLWKLPEILVFVFVLS